MMALILTGAFHLFSLGKLPLLSDFILLAILLNIVLAVFNLIPIPPLDGSRLVYALLQSPRAVNVYNRFARYGIIVFIAFLLLGGFQVIILPLVAVLYSLLRLPIPT